MASRRTKGDLDAICKSIAQWLRDNEKRFIVAVPMEVEVQHADGLIELLPLHRQELEYLSTDIPIATREAQHNFIVWGHDPNGRLKAIGRCKHTNTFVDEHIPELSRIFEAIAKAPKGESVKDVLHTDLPEDVYKVLTEDAPEVSAEEPIKGEGWGSW